MLPEDNVREGDSFRISFSAGSSEKPPLAITLMAGASLSEGAGLRAVCYVLMAIRRPDVTGLRDRGAQDRRDGPSVSSHPRIQESEPERHRAGFDDFLLHFDSPITFPV
jgi:hypothetical protein